MVCLDRGLVRDMPSYQKALVGLFAGCVVGSAVVGFFISFGITFQSVRTMSRINRDSLSRDRYITDRILGKVDRESLDKYQQWLAEQAHPATDPRDHQIASWIKEVFQRDLKLDHVAVHTYSVLLTLPPAPGKTNKVELIDGNNEAIESSDEVYGVSPSHQRLIR